MSLKDLKAGIVSQDWDQVRAAYENMTGDTIVLEKLEPKKRGRPKKEPEQPEPVVSKPVIKRKTIQKGFRILEDTIERDTKPKFITNLFEDSGTGKKEQLTPEEEEAIAALNSSRIVRPDPHIEVRCKQCGKVEMVRGALAQNKSYKCNRCCVGE